MLDLFGLGQIGTAIVAVLGAFGAIWAALWGARRSGANSANAKRDAESARDYIAERKRQDEIDVGHGASDAERIRMLEAIRDRRGASKD